MKYNSNRKNTTNKAINPSNSLLNTQDLRFALALASVKYSINDKITHESFLKAGASLNINKDNARLLFPDYQAQIPATLAKILRLELESYMKIISNDLRVSKKISTGLTEYFKIAEKFKPLILCYYTDSLIASSSKQLARESYLIADIIWESVLKNAPRSTFDYYSRRISLSSVIISSSLFWIKNDDVSCLDSHIDRQIEKVLNIVKIKKLLKLSTENIDIKDIKNNLAKYLPFTDNPLKMRD